MYWADRHIKREQRDRQKLVLSSTGILNLIAGIGTARPPSGLRYGNSNRHLLDVYLPTKQPASVIVFLYGGGWEEGERSDYFFVGSALAAQGFITVIPDYRVYPEVGFPGFIEDAAAAFRWTVDHIESFGGNRRRIIVMGHSAGAYIAAMLAFDRKWLANVDLNTQRDVQAMIGLAGPYDFLPLRGERLQKIFAPKVSLAATQPINFVDALAPPAFLASGQNDRTVDPGNTKRLAERMLSFGGDVEIKLYRGLDHRLLIGALARPLRFLAPVLDDITDFVARLGVRRSVLPETALRDLKA